MKLDRYAKAIVGALVTGVGMYQASRQGGVTSDEWIAILVAITTALGAIWAVPNKEVEPEVQIVNAEREIEVLDE